MDLKAYKALQDLKAHKDMTVQQEQPARKASRDYKVLQDPKVRKVLQD